MQKDAISVRIKPYFEVSLSKHVEEQINVPRQDNSYLDMFESQDVLPLDLRAADHVARQDRRLHCDARKGHALIEKKTMKRHDLEN